MSEKNLLNKLQLLASSLGNRLWRNNNGLAWAGQAIHLKDGSVLIKQPRPIKYGLGVGTGDLIGGSQITVTAEMVGKKIFVFTNYEVKTNKTRISKEQKNFHDMVSALGGISIIDRFSSNDVERNAYEKSIAGFQGIK